MKRHIRYFVTLAASVAVFAACDSSGPDEIFSVRNYSELSSGTSNVNVVPTTETKRASRVDGVIGSEGGSISAGGHTLLVPAGAVPSPTQFMLQVVEAKAIHVRLKAWRVSDGASITQFPVVPVQLKVNVAELTDVDQSRLVVIYLRDGSYDGNKEVMRSVFDSGTKILTGFIPHFSEYTVGIDRKSNSGSGSYSSGEDSSGSGSGSSGSGSSGSNSGPGSGYYYYP